MHPLRPKTSLTGLTLGLGIILTSQARADETVNTAANVGDALVTLLLYLPAGLLLAAVPLEILARARSSRSLNSGVFVILVCAAACAAGALLAAAVVPDKAAALAGTPFATPALGALFTGLALVACLTKWLCTRTSPASAGSADKPKPKRRGRGRGRRRGAPGKKRGGGAIAMLVKTVYVGSLAAAAAALIGGPIVIQTATPFTRDLLLSSHDDVGAASPAGEQRAPEAEPEPKPKAEPKPEPEPEPAAAPVIAAVEHSPPAEPEMVGEPAPPSEPAPDGDPEPTPDAATPRSVDTEPVVPQPEPPPGAKIPTPAVRPVVTQHGGLAGAETYKKLIQPILRSRCYDCHGSEKQKGDLRLDTLEGIRKGGKSGPVIIAGNVEKSYLYELVSLPEDDDDIMPPKGKPLSEAQVSWIGGWIREGAALGDGVDWPVPEGGSNTGLEIDALADGVGAPDSAALQRLLNGGVLVRKLSTGGKLVEVDYSHADRAAGDLRLEELAPLAANIHTLDLKRTKITDNDLKVVGTFSNLRVLHLQRTKTTDAGLEHLSGLSQLESLNLYDTQVSDAGLPHLKKLTSLKKIYLWSTQVTSDGARDLASTLRSTVVNMGE